ncbi:uncharacterized protein TM35_000881010 [Trypanosoma theileri]|uniref:Uncharacterized protein n=1 Tax=Trypanosoma theileri TaxID=67003 RepID=A0A1X0NFD2_9TRYP|nr:uncharacterized protein TM35_000881010 [Trypanosoma theileri]ORC82522.1 hypothetical protein TM35_000881010 [Trypanosoma theileri]
MATGVPQKKKKKYNPGAAWGSPFPFIFRAKPNDDLPIYNVPFALWNGKNWKVWFWEKSVDTTRGPVILETIVWWETQKRKQNERQQQISGAFPSITLSPRGGNS